MNELIVKEYLGSGIEFKVIEGEVYANATSMCKPFNKTPKDWLRTAQTQRYISALEQKANMPNEMVSKNRGGDKNIGITKKGLKFIEMNLDEIKTK